MTIKNNILYIKKSLPKEVTLVAVSKTKPTEAILEAYQAGQRIFGENKVQEMVAKHEQLPKDIQWHMIGHVQRNKIKYMATFVSLIHGVENFKTLVEINKQAIKNKRIINCLLQIKIAAEETKFGMQLEEAKYILQAPEFAALQNIQVQGVMGMATHTKDKAKITSEFSNLKQVFNVLKEIHPNNSAFKIISMGMSSDYPIAVACGSNMVRIGSSIFGERNYSK